MYKSYWIQNTIKNLKFKCILNASNDVLYYISLQEEMYLKYI